MRYASEDLVNEHEGILLGLSILESMVHRLKEKKEVEVDDVKEMVHFLRLFADKCHHGKEEGFYFPAMEKVGVPNEKGPIGQMLIEHSEGRGYVSEMAGSIEQDTLSASQFTSAATAYIGLLRAHIEKENTVLFPLGNRTIPLDVQARLLETFETFEVEVMGVGTHERLHELLHRFQHKYLQDGQHTK